MAYHKYADKRHKPLIEDFLLMFSEDKYLMGHIYDTVAKKHGYEPNSVKKIITGAKAKKILAERKKNDRLQRAS